MTLRTSTVDDYLPTCCVSVGAAVEMAFGAESAEVGYSDVVCVWSVDDFDTDSASSDSYTLGSYGSAGSVVTCVEHLGAVAAAALVYDDFVTAVWASVHGVSGPTLKCVWFDEPGAVSVIASDGGTVVLVSLLADVGDCVSVVCSVMSIL